MNITTKLDFGQKVLKLIDGRLVTLKVNQILINLTHFTLQKGCTISYACSPEGFVANFDKPFNMEEVKFEEEEVGRTIFTSREELLDYVTGLAAKAEGKS